MTDVTKTELDALADECERETTYSRARMDRVVKALRLASGVAQGAEGSELADPLADLVTRFSNALLRKLKLAQANGRSGWEKDDWEDHCKRGLLAHVEKGDPRDVAAYCAFMWHHSWTTAPAAPPPMEENGDAFNEMASQIWAAGASPSDADFITRMLAKKGLYLVLAEPWKHCPSTHCERRGECASPRDCTVKTPVHSGQISAQKIDDAAQYLAQWIGYAWTGLRPERIGGDFKPWCFNGIGQKQFQGGQEDLRDVVREVLKRTHSPAGSIDTAIASIPPDLNWLMGKGKQRPDEPLYGVQLLRGLKPIAETENDDLATAIRDAVAASPTQSGGDKA